MATIQLRVSSIGRQHGSGYVEVMVAAFLLALCLTPAIDSVTNAIREGGIPLRTTRSDILCVKSQLDSVTAEPYSTLLSAAVAAGSVTVASSYSIAATATCPALQVYVARYDADKVASPYATTDTGLLLIKATSLDNTVSLSTLATRR